MKICILHERFNIAGGVIRVSTEIANLLYRNGHSVSLIDFSGHNVYYYEVAKGVKTPHIMYKDTMIEKYKKAFSYINNKLTNNPVKYHKIYNRKINLLTRYLLENKIEVLILCQGLLTSLIPYIKHRFSSIKIVAWQHNEFDIYINNYYKRFIECYLNGIKNADAVVCLTKCDQRKFKKFNNNSYVIYNPLTIENDKLKSSLDKKIILFVGRLILQQKGLDYIIEIAKNIDKEWKIVIAGDGPDKMIFKKLIKSNNLVNKIELLGQLNNDELKYYYVNSSILISTSRWEGFGLVITEAMSFGLPIVSFSNQGPNEILEDGKYGMIIEKGNIKQFINHLNILIEDADKRFYYQEKSLERVEYFKRENILVSWENLLQKLTNEMTGTIDKYE